MTKTRLHTSISFT